MMAIDELAKLKRNLEQRKAAEVALELAITIASEGKWNEDQRYWEILRDMIAERFCDEKDSKESCEVVDRSKMTDEESRRFGQSEVVPFGEFKGQRVDADQTFTDDLRRYLRSDRIASERRREVE